MYTWKKGKLNWNKLDIKNEKKNGIKEKKKQKIDNLFARLI